LFGINIEVFFHYLLAELDSYSHGSCHSWLIVEVISCEVKIFTALFVSKIFVKLMIEPVKQLSLALYITYWLYETLWPIMHSQTILSQFKLVLDLFRNGLINLLCNLLLNLIMINLDLFFIRRQFLGPFLCEFLTCLNYCNVPFVWWIFLLMETNESEVVIFEQNAVWRFTWFHSTYVHFENCWNLFCILNFVKLRC